MQFFFNLTSYFQIYGTFKFYENANFRAKGLFKNPHCTKYINSVCEKFQTTRAKDKVAPVNLIYGGTFLLRKPDIKCL